jgi:hypothetical protein
MKKMTMFNTILIPVIAFLLPFFLGQQTLAGELPVLVIDMKSGFPV